jgi:hypothetical protein
MFKIPFHLLLVFSNIRKTSNLLIGLEITELKEEDMPIV